jgi:hypothetical protein
VWGGAGLRHPHLQIYPPGVSTLGRALGGADQTVNTQVRLSQPAGGACSPLVLPLSVSNVLGIAPHLQETREGVTVVAGVWRGVRAGQGRARQGSVHNAGGWRQWEGESCKALAAPVLAFMAC